MYTVYGLYGAQISHLILEYPVQRPHSHACNRSNNAPLHHEVQHPWRLEQQTKDISKGNKGKEKGSMKAKERDTIKHMDKDTDVATSTNTAKAKKSMAAIH